MNLLNDIIIPKEIYQTLKFKSVLSDGFTFNGGILPGQNILLTGTPGAGKTTLCLYLMHKLSFKSLFMSYEMPIYQSKIMYDRFASPLNPLINISDDIDIDAALEQCNNNNIKLIIIDSLQKLCTFPHIKARFGEGEIPCQKNLTTYLMAKCKELKLALILIGHCDKGGKYLGPSSIKHDADTHLQLSKQLNTEYRIAYFDKNRFGSKYDTLLYTIHNKGLSVFTPEQAESNSRKNIIARSEHFYKRDPKYFDQVFLDYCQNVITYLYNKYKVDYDLTRPVTVIFSSQLAHTNCDVFTNNIIISMRQISLIEHDSIISYEAEEWIWERVCKSSVHRMITYILLHEFTHLKHTEHDKKFNKEIERLCKENYYLFQY